MSNTSEGLRYNQGKMRWDLLPMDALNEVAKVATYGASKYEPRNWEKGLSWSACFASFMRHFYARCTGEVIDPESGCMHTAHMAWNALAILAFDSRDTGTNDLQDMVIGVEEKKPVAVAPLLNRKPGGINYV